jgi:hypothetical protein
MTRAFAFVLLLAAACGTEAPMPPGETKSLFPISVGNRWTYVVDSGAKPEKTQSVTGTIAVDGRAAYVLETLAGDFKRVVSHQALDGDKLVRAREKTYNGNFLIEDLRFTPWALRVDLGATELGATYQSVHTEEVLDANGEVVPPTIMKTQTFFVEAVDDTINVPAGMFRCVRVRRDTTGGPSKTFWFAPGVGKVRETGGQTEDLSSYEVEDER